MHRPLSLPLIAFVFCALMLATGGCGSGSPSDGQSAGDSIAAAAPQTDVLLGSLDTSDGLHVGNLEPVTRRQGYDNQPTFTAAGEHLLWTSIRGDQSDVYRWPIGQPADSTVRLTTTAQSEYSPTLRPGGGLSIVRVEDDGRQRLWHYSSAGTPIEPIFPEGDSIGYHAWLDDDRVALFVLGSPPTLHVRSISTGRDTVVTSGIGRSLQPLPGRVAVSFVRVRDDSSTAIHVLDGKGTGLRTRRLVDSPQTGRGDFHAWMPNGTLLMAEGGSLWVWQRGDADWAEIASFGERSFTRLAVSPTGGHLALVEEK